MTWLTLVMFRELAYNPPHSNMFHMRVPTLLSIRPTVAQHSIVLLSRSVHPELFQLCRTQYIQRTNYNVRLDITSEGHVVTFSTPKGTLCEVVAADNQPLPVRRRLTGRTIACSDNFRIETKNQIRYETNFGVEHASKELFWRIQQQFGRSSGDHELLQVFGSSGRAILGAISYMHVEQRSRQFTVQAFHTFPDDYSIVKSYSTFTVMS
jgi:hypothetical protein